MTQGGQVARTLLLALTKDRGGFASENKKVLFRELDLGRMWSYRRIMSFSIHSFHDTYP
jgi:hypothetical protein